MWRSDPVDTTKQHPTVDTLLAQARSYRPASGEMLILLGVLFAGYQSWLKGDVASHSLFLIFVVVAIQQANTRRHTALVDAVELLSKQTRA